MPRFVPSVSVPIGDDETEREFSLPLLTLMAFFVGVVAAIGAIIFKYMIAVVTNLAFYGRFSTEFAGHVYGPESFWGIGVIFVPVVGGLIVVWIVQTFAPEAKGHGVPEVMYAIYHRGGNVRGIVSIAKSFASAISIGTGASVGREGPIIQIGASFGSTLGRRLRLVRSQKIILLAAGAGAGIAATFNTPLGGVLFAVEVLLPEISPRSFLPVVAATATSTYGYRLLIGAEATFQVPLFRQLPVETPVNFPEIVTAAATGIVMGLAAWLFVVVLEFTEDRFDASKFGPYIQNAFGMTLVGLLGYAFFAFTGHYHVLGVGYATIQDIIADNITLFWLLVAIGLGKLVATCLSLGSGASGGIFSPSLVIGASLGGAVGVLGLMVFPDSGLQISTFAIIGMGAMVGAGTSAAMTAIVMIYEMTRDYNLILPLVLAVAIALGIRRSLVTNDIYTIKLRKRGQAIPTDRTTNMFLVQPVNKVMTKDFIVLPVDMTVKEALAAVEVTTNRVIVTDGSRIAGFVRFSTVPYQADLFTRETLADIMQTDYVIASNAMTLNGALTRMSRRNRSFAIVVERDAPGVPRAENVIGVIDREELAQAVIRNHYA